MKSVMPDYLPSFKCIAGRCRHTCCAGWEIDIDEYSLERWQQVKGPFGERLRGCIEQDADSAHFCLLPGDRCPLLRADGLCEMIVQLGEDSLCDICADHPRFRNFFSDREELGLGMCCEEAARLILTRETPVCLMEMGDEALRYEETALLSLRAEAIGLAQDRTLSMEERLCRLEEEAGGAVFAAGSEAAALLRPLERLDAAWEERLDCLEKQPSLTLCNHSDTPLEQLCVYFLFRHLPGAAEDGRFTERLLMCTLLTRVTAAISRGMDDLIEAARQISGEIEYSDENIGLILDKIGEKTQNRSDLFTILP